MEQIIIREGIPLKINERELELAVPEGVRVSYRGKVTWQHFPQDTYDETHPDYPSDLTARWVERPHVFFYGPITEPEARQILAAHKPTETTEEEQQRLSIETLEASLNELPLIQDMLRRLDALDTLVQDMLRRLDALDK